MQKAILINSSRLGRVAPNQAMGTQTGWQPDWGWGALNLEGASAERTNGANASVPGDSAKFFTASGVAATDRATLVWHRRGTSGCFTGSCIPDAMTLTNLDLQQLDPATGAVQAQSSSAIDNVEQVRSPGSAPTAIYKVKATSTVDGLPAEPFAITARRPLTPLVTPAPVVTVDVADASQRARQTTTVTATVRNPSPDLTAENASVALQLPEGVELIDGAQTRTLGTLATDSAIQTFTWTVRGTTDGATKISAHAQASRYGETFSATTTDDYVVDGSAPAPTIASPQGTTAQRKLAVAWGATDAHSTIAHYDVEASIDGGPWSAWLDNTAQTEATYAGSADHRYRFRVRATDSLGNESGWVESSEVRIADPPSSNPTPPVQPPPTPTLRTTSLTLATVKRTRSGISIAGKIDPAATGRVALVYSTKIGRKTYKSRTTTARVKRGRFIGTLRLPAKARKPRRGTLAMSYSGDARFAARALKRTVVAR